MTVVIPTDRPKSVRNRCVTKLLMASLHNFFWWYCVCKRSGSDLFLFLFKNENTLQWWVIFIGMSSIENVWKRHWYTFSVTKETAMFWALVCVEPHCPRRQDNAQSYALMVRLSSIPFKVGRLLSVWVVVMIFGSRKSEANPGSRPCS